MAGLEDKIAEEIEQLKRDIVRLGAGNADGKYEVAYGVLFDDPEVEQYYEALLGTLKAAKKAGVLDFKGQMLLKGAHDNVPITLLIPPGDAPAPPAPAAPAAVEEATEAVAAVSVSDGAAAEEENSGAAEEPAAPSGGGGGGGGGGGKAYTGSKADGSPPEGFTDGMRSSFADVAGRDADAQCEFFLKSFIFALGDNWKEIPELLKDYRKAGGETGMNHVQASDFLQKHGKTRTGTQRKNELDDVDINNDGIISFLEYLLLHYKVLILNEYYKRYEDFYPNGPEEDLSQDGIGLCGVGYKLVDELLTLPKGMNPQLTAAIESFTEAKKAREQKIKTLKAKADKGGVKGMAAQQELTIMESEDSTEINRVELTLQAAMRRADKRRGSQALNEQKAKAEAELKKAAEEKRAKLAAKRAMFEGKK